jgi:hypothetical protein
LDSKSNDAFPLAEEILWPAAVVWDCRRRGHSEDVVQGSKDVRKTNGEVRRRTWQITIILPGGIMR